MAERTEVTQLVQLGVETTPGTGVAATRKLATVGFDSHIQTSIETFAPAGYKYLTTAALNREWMQATIKGKPNYNELQYLLAGIINGPGTPTTVESGVYKYVFDSAVAAPDTPTTFTVEQGSSVRAHKWTFGLVREFGIRFTRESTELSGQMIGQKLQDGITLSGSTTTPGGSIAPIVGSQFDLFIDPAHTGLGTTKQTRFLSGNLSINNRYGPLWVMDTAVPSWLTDVEMLAAGQFTAIFEADSAGMAQFAQLRAADVTQFLRIRALGLAIGATSTQSWTFDCAAKIGAVEPFSNDQGVYAIGLRYDIVYDDTWGKALHSEVINTVATLA